MPVALPSRLEIAEDDPSGQVKVCIQPVRFLEILGNINFNTELTLQVSEGSKLPLRFGFLSVCIIIK